MNAVSRQTLDAAPHCRIKAPQQDTGHADTTAPTPSGRIWLALQTHPQAERFAAQNLTRSGYETYLPMLVIQRRDRVLPTLLHRIERPLFSGYLFVATDEHEPWTPIRYTSGIWQVLMSGSKPHHVPEAVISAVQAGEALRRLPLPDTVLYRPGAPVKCLYGPFQGLDAVIISAATTTARIALPMLGAIREIVVPIKCLSVRE